MNLKLLRKTESWKENRSLRIAQNPFCECCGGTIRLSVHHNRKARNEEDYLSLKDTSVLCSACHYHLHKGSLRQCQMCGTVFSFTEENGTPRESIRGHYWYCRSCCELFDESMIVPTGKTMFKVLPGQASLEKYALYTVPNVKRGNEAPPSELLHWM